MRSQRVAELDLLRLIAASAVVVYHYTYTPLIEGQLSPATFNGLQLLSRYGYLGVDLFFMISGFVILWSAEGKTPSQFVRSRFLRLYPMFWIGLAITLLTLLIADRADGLTLGDVAANVTMLPRYLGSPLLDSVYWTLAVEFKFYVCIFLALLVRQMQNIEWWIYAWLAALMIGASVRSQILDWLTIAPYGFFFVGGAICYLIRKRGLSWFRILALLLCAEASMQAAALDTTGFTTSILPADPRHIEACVAVFYAVLFMISVNMVRLPDSNWVYSLGALTYPLYLLHNQIGKALFAKLPVTSEWTKLGFAMLISYSLAWLCSRFLEPWGRKGVLRALQTGTMLFRKPVRP
jgi:peptidoglycan/LPS O-acetylase OafA/YrhL